VIKFMFLQVSCETPPMIKTP